MAIKLDTTLTVESRLPIEPLINKETKKLIHDGIPFVKIKDVSVQTTKHERGEYAGLEVPELQIEVINHKLKADEPDRFLLIRHKTIHSKKLMQGSETEFEFIDGKMVNDLTEQMYMRVKHIYDAFSFSPSYVNFAKLTKAQVNEFFNLPDTEDALSPEERVNAFSKFYGFIADAFNGKLAGEDGTPVYKDGNSYHVMRLKVVAEYSRGNYFTIPTYVGQGFIEKAIIKDSKWQSPIKVYKKPKDRFELSEATDKSSVLKELSKEADEDTAALLKEMDI